MSEAILSECTKEEMCSVIRFLSSEGSHAGDIVRRMQEKYGDSCLDTEEIFNYIDQFKSGRTSVYDDREVLTLNLDADIEQIKQMIRNDNHAKVEDIAKALNITQGYVYLIIHKNLKYRKVLGRWVPRKMTNGNNKQKLVKHPKKR